MRSNTQTCIRLDFKTDQNIKKIYKQKELNLRCIKTNKKTRVFFFHLPRNESREY